MRDYRFHSIKNFAMSFDDATRIIQLMWSRINQNGQVTVAEYYRMCHHPEFINYSTDDQIVWTKGIACPINQNPNVKEYCGFSPKLVPVMDTENGELKWALDLPVPHFVGYANNTYFDRDVRCPNPIRIIKNGPATTVCWTDGTKTTVKKAPDQSEADDAYLGYCAAVCKHLYGSNSALKKLINDHLVVEDKKNG